MFTSGKTTLKQVATLIAAFGVLTACTIGTPDFQLDSPTATPEVPVEETLSEAPGLDGIENTIKDLERQGNTVGLVIVSNEGAVQYGSLKEGAAWSTMKVPIASAVMKTDYADTAGPLIDAAITESDNAAALSLWNLLGGGDESAEKVNAVIQGGGDKATFVPTRKRNKEFSPFGQTNWKLAEQAKFFAGWRCRPEAERVLESMHNIIEGHSYGIGQLDDAAFKGGWGPDDDGMYLVRQAGIVPWGGGEVTIAMGVIPKDGTYDSGVSVLNLLGLKVGEFLNQTQPGEFRWEPLPLCGKKKND